ncbi:MAG: MMPL family transporter [Spirochaetaceae bacterium]|jgi:predicted RND superfamily exporter protein|nr:MMPL family transporter [Spirochaetaceae bacterium]
MKKFLFPSICLMVCGLFFIFDTPSSENEAQIYADIDSHLLLPQRNVVIVALDLKGTAYSFNDIASLKKINLLQQDFNSMEGVSKVESILNASMITSQGDDITVQRALPEDLNILDGDDLLELTEEIPNFPELQPYINGKMDTLLFYIYFGYKTPAAKTNTELLDLQKKWVNELPFQFTGKSPIISQTESLLTKDIALFLPLLFIMIVLVLLSFRNFKAILFSFILLILAVFTSYGMIHFIGIPNSPLLLLIPVFSLGLLSDYIIHYFYHRMYSSVGLKKADLTKKLLFPLSLTALSTVTGFLSLVFINGSGHVQLGSIISVAVVLTWIGVFLWLNTQNFPRAQKSLFPKFQESQTRFFEFISKKRFFLFALILVMIIWGIFQLKNLKIEPYPIEQLPNSTTIKQADRIINREFYGTLPFFLEIDTGEKNAVLQKDTLLKLNEINNIFTERDLGYSYSLLTVMKRIHYYFNGSEETLLADHSYDDFFPTLIEQYLIFYSSSVDPLEYESLLDSSYRYVSVKGLLYYENVEDLETFYQIIEDIKADLPEQWDLQVYGMAAELEQEKNNLQTNWIFSFLVGSFLIFITVLIFYRKLSLALLSLVPGLISMIISFGIISVANISIDAFSIIFVAIITGLVIDYSIHTLIALDQLEAPKTLKEGFSHVMGYSGLPIFLSFLTSLFSFSILLLSSFRGARSLGILLMTSLILSYFFSLYLLPLIILPFKIKKE